jgi:hypothetical protein
VTRQARAAIDISAVAEELPSYPRPMVVNDLSGADEIYIRDNYFTLEELCAGRPETLEAVRKLIRDRLLPAPAYVLDDGSEMFPADYFVLVDQAGGHERLRRHFDSRHRRAGGDAAELDEDWDGYLSGVYSVCLRQVSPETMVRKTQLVASLTELLDDPKPESSDWRARLRRQVWELDVLEREFSPDYDRGGRFPEPPSRDRLIAAARERFPDVFAAGASVE